MKLILLLLLINTQQIHAQMKMSVDPKTSKIKYDVLGNVTKVLGDVFKQSTGETSSSRIGLKFGIKKVISSLQVKKVMSRLSSLMIRLYLLDLSHTSLLEIINLNQ